MFILTTFIFKILHFHYDQLSFKIFVLTASEYIFLIVSSNSPLQFDLPKMLKKWELKKKVNRIELKNHESGSSKNNSGISVFYFCPRHQLSNPEHQRELSLKKQIIDLVFEETKCTEGISIPGTSKKDYPSISQMESEISELRKIRDSQVLKLWKLNSSSSSPSNNQKKINSEEEDKVSYLSQMEDQRRSQLKLKAETTELLQVLATILSSSNGKSPSLIIEDISSLL